MRVSVREFNSPIGLARLSGCLERDRCELTPDAGDEVPLTGRHRRDEQCLDMHDWPGARLKTSDAVAQLSGLKSRLAELMQ